MRLSERIVNRGIERRRRHKRAELGNRIGEAQSLRDLRRSFKIEWSQLPIELKRMAELLMPAGHLRQLGRERFHRAVLYLVRQRFRWERKDVVKGDRSEPARNFPGRG